MKRAFLAGPVAGAATAGSLSGGGDRLMRPNVALGASNAPNVAFGASNAPNATLGRLGHPLSPVRATRECPRQGDDSGPPVP
jgi:hypothetical protein